MAMRHKARCISDIIEHLSTVLELSQQLVAVPQKFDCSVELCAVHISAPHVIVEPGCLLVHCD